MSKRWVVNASPLIVLGKIGRIALLNTLSDELVVPDVVAQEIQAGDIGDIARKWLFGEGSRQIQTVGKPDPIIAGWDLGAGESAVLSFARQHSGFEALIDDRAARNCAKALQIPVRGTLGVLLFAKHEGALSQVKPVIQELQNAGMRVDSETIQIILELAGE